MRGVQRHPGSWDCSACSDSRTSISGQSQAGGALPDQCGGRAGRHPDGGGRQRPHPGAAGRSALRPGPPLPAAIPRHQGSHRADPPPGTQRRARFAGAALPCQRRRTAPRKSTAKATSAISPSNTACAGATWAAPSKRLSPKSSEQVKLPRGYHIGWEGEYESQKRSSARLMVVVPATVILIFMIIYNAFGSVKWALLDTWSVCWWRRLSAGCWPCG